MTLHPANFRQLPLNSAVAEFGRICRNMAEFSGNYGIGGVKRRTPPLVLSSNKSFSFQVYFEEQTAPTILKGISQIQNPMYR